MTYITKDVVVLVKKKIFLATLTQLLSDLPFTSLLYDFVEFSSYD